jgi:dihydrofolate reductase
MKLIMYPAITLDGFIADPNGECDSWINDEDDTLYRQAIEKTDCVLVGRKTYEQYVDDFAQDEGPTTFVWTTHADQQDKPKIKFLRGTPKEIIKQIETYGFSELIVSGGGEVNGALATVGLIDEVIVSIYNVTLGEGIPLFGSHRPKLRLKLLATSNDIEGIVKNHYRVIK